MQEARRCSRCSDHDLELPEHLPFPYDGSPTPSDHASTGSEARRTGMFPSAARMMGTMQTPLDAVPAKINPQRRATHLCVMNGLPVWCDDQHVIRRLRERGGETKGQADLPEKHAMRAHRNFSPRE